METAILLASDGSGTDRFGDAVDISGDTVIVGAHQSSPNGLGAAGSAYVFERQEGSWVETQKLVASDVAANARFGDAVSTDGDTIVIGATQAHAVGSFSGAVYVFERQGGAWVETAKLVGDDTAPWNTLGNAVGVDGDRLVAASHGARKVYIFEKEGGSWVQTAKISGDPDVTGDAFAARVALEGTRLVVAAYGEKLGTFNGAGAVYIYELEGSRWVEAQKLISMRPQPFFNFGQSVGLSGPTLVVGEPQAKDFTDGGTIKGAFQVFRETPAGWKGLLLFMDLEGEAGSSLGRAVAVSGEHVAAGAPQAANGTPGTHCFVGHVWLVDAPLHARSHCFGKGCPCFNPDPSAGCRSSLGMGARLSGCGGGSVAADEATFLAERLPPGRPALLFRGLEALNGGSGVQFGDGKLCTGSQAVRMDVRFADAAGTATWGPGLSAQGGWLPGDTMHLQVWYRDPEGSPCGTGFNFTNAVETHFGP